MKIDQEIATRGLIITQHWYSMIRLTPNGDLCPRLRHVTPHPRSGSSHSGPTLGARSNPRSNRRGARAFAGDGGSADPQVSRARCRRPRTAILPSDRSPGAGLGLGRRRFAIPPRAPHLGCRADPSSPPGNNLERAGPFDANPPTPAPPGRPRPRPRGAAGEGQPPQGDHGARDLADRRQGINKDTKRRFGELDSIR